MIWSTFTTILSIHKLIVKWVKEPLKFYPTFWQFNNWKTCAALKLMPIRLKLWTRKLTKASLAQGVENGIKDGMYRES